jgi:beta-glucanase (GH16 family)
VLYRALATRRRLALALTAGVAVLALVAGLVMYADGGTIAGIGGGVQWHTAWSASFSGPAGSKVSPRSWSYDTGSSGFGNGEVEVMTSSANNVFLDGRGDLDIAAIYQGTLWTSGRIVSTQQFAAPAGGQMMVSASIQQPDAADALGYWPAFWLLGPGPWPADGEIDVMEDVNGLSETAGTLHCGNLTQRDPDGSFGPCHEYTGLSSGLRPCPDCQQGYQTYSVIVDRRDAADEQIRWYLNGHEYSSVSESQVGAAVWDKAVNHGFSIILDLAMGGTYPQDQCHCTAPDSQTSSGGVLSVRSLTVSYAGG